MRDDQCRPTDDMQNRQPGRQSVCRQCFSTCDSTGSNGQYCLHHGTSTTLNNGDVSIVAASVTSMKISKWDNQVATTATYYDLEDNATGGRTLSFWGTDLLSESIVNWAGQGKSY